MDPIDNIRRAAEDLVTYARQQGVDLDPLYDEGSFTRAQRWLSLWRKDDLPWSGPTGEREGVIHYSMQGAISNLPRCMPKAAVSAFRGSWSEAGVLENLDQALRLVKMWLLDRVEVDDLPTRTVRRAGSDEVNFVPRSASRFRRNSAAAAAA